MSSNDVLETSWKWLISWKDFVSCSCVFLGAEIQRSGSLIMTSPLASYSEVPQTTCEEKNAWEKEEKSIGFHYPVGQCHWPVNDPVTVVQGRHGPTLNRCWQEENMLTGTRNKLEHRFALQASRPKRYCARPPRGEGRGEGLRMVGIGVGW